MNDPAPEQVSAFDEAANWYILLREEPEDAALRERFAQWLAAEAGNADAWAAMDATAGVLERTPPDLRARIKGHAMSTRSASGRRRALRHWPAASRLHGKRRVVLAAAIAACLAIMVAPSLWLRATTDHLTGVGQVETVRLPDGSQAILGPGSAARLDFADGRRVVELVSGQAFFAVRPDPAHPFEVEAHGVRTTVLGTAFDVRLLGDDIHIGVDHGRVRVQSRAAKEELAAGDWTRIDRDGHMRKGRQSPDLAGAWRTGKAFVRNRTIADVIDEIRPWQQGRILLMDRRLGAQKVTGIYDVSNPANALELLVNPYGGRVIQVTPWLLIVTG